MGMFGKQHRRRLTHSHKRRLHSHRPRLGLLERLEDRRLLAITADFSGGVLTFTGDGGDNQLTITASDSTSTSVSFSSASDTIALSGGATNPQNGITSIVVALGGGDDTLTVVGTTAVDSFSLVGLTLTFGATPYSLDADLERLIVQGRENSDSLSASGNSTTLDFELDGGTGDDSFTIGALDTGRMLVRGVQGGGENDLAQITGALVRTQAEQLYSFVRVVVTTDVVFDAGVRIHFNEPLNGAFDVEVTSPGEVGFAADVGDTTPLASLEISTNEQLDLLHNITTSGDITLSLPEQAPGDDDSDIVIAGSAIIRSLSGKIDVFAGDEFLLDVNAQMHAATTLFVRFGFNTNDGSGANASLHGVMSAGSGPSSLQVIGSQFDNFIVLRRFPQSTMSILAGGGYDRLVVNGSNANEVFNIYATQINVEGNSLATDVVYVAVEDLTVNGQEGNDDVRLQLPVSPLESLPQVVQLEGVNRPDALDRIWISGTAGNDIIHVGRGPGNDNAQVRVHSVHVLQVFGLGGDDFISNTTLIQSVLLDGGFGNDRLIGFIYTDLLFGGAGMDWLQGGDGHDLLYADYDFNFGNPVQGASDYDKLDGGLGYDILLALGIDQLVQETAGDTSRDRVVGDRNRLAFSPTFPADFVDLTNQSIAETLQLRLNVPAGYPI